MGYPLVYVDRTGVFTGTAGVAWHCGATPWPEPNSLQVAGASKTPHMTHATTGPPCTTLLVPQWVPRCVDDTSSLCVMTLGPLTPVKKRRFTVVLFFGSVTAKGYRLSHSILALRTVRGAGLGGNLGRDRLLRAVSVVLRTVCDTDSHSKTPDALRQNVAPGAGSDHLLLQRRR